MAQFRRSQGRIRQRWADDEFAPAYDDLSGEKVMLRDLREDFDGTKRQAKYLDGWHPATFPPSIIDEVLPIKDPRPGNERHGHAVRLLSHGHGPLHVHFSARPLIPVIDDPARNVYFWLSPRQLETAFPADAEIITIMDRQLNFTVEIPTFTTNQYIYLARHSSRRPFRGITFDQSFDQKDGFQDGGRIGDFDVRRTENLLLGSVMSGVDMEVRL